MARKMQRYLERRYNDEGKSLCLVPICNNLAALKKNGNERNYCINHRWSDMRKFTNWRDFSRTIIERDGNRCTKCGDNRETIKIERNEKVYNWGIKEPFRKKENYRKVISHVSNLEVHHIKEVAIDGDMWNPDNCQTLCYSCHKKKTSHFNSKRHIIKTIYSGEQKTLLRIAGKEKTGNENNKM